MGRLEATILVIVTAPTYGALLSYLVERLSVDRAVPVGYGRCSSCDQPFQAVRSRTSERLRSLGRRCRLCGALGSADAMPIALAAAAVALWALFAGAPAGPSVVLGWTLLVLSVIDWRHLLLPDALTLPLLAAGLAVGAVVGSWPDHLAGAAAGAASLMLVGSVFGQISGKEGLGMGDVKLFAAGGAWTGWQALPGTLLVAALLGLAFAVLAGRAGEGRHRPIAFGPFLAAGIWVSWLHGPLSL